MVLTMSTKAILTMFSILQGTILCQAETQPEQTHSKEIGMKNVALHKPANQSYTYVDPGNSEAWVAGRAVDDCLIRNPYTPPYCCSATLADTNNYWHLNLQDEYQVQRIVIYGRTEMIGATQLEGFKLYIYNSANSHPQEVLEVQENVEGSNEYMVDFGIIQFIKEIRLTLAYTLVLCEVQVFAACDGGYYGINCTLTCGNCSENAACNKTTGECPGGCSSGWKPPLCNEICDSGTWGVNCANNCGQCHRGTVCDAVHGNCQFGCKPGWKGQQCNEPCEDGEFGTNCSFKCGHCYNGAACNKTTGYCPADCDPGWKWDDRFCNTTCDDGFYGTNCYSTCGECHDNASCYKTTGVCPGGCKLGLKPPLCISTCDYGSWGLNCSNDCGQCLNGTICHVENGVCISGCNSGWKGSRCNEACEDGTYGDSCLCTCGHCSELQSCNKITGYCPNGCSSGWKWKDPLCTTICDDGTWGVNCSSECQNCLNDTKCDTINGFCPNGCTAGWRGPTCNTMKTDVGQNDNAAAAVGGSVAGFIIICVVIGAIVLWKLRKHRKDDPLPPKFDVQINKATGLPFDKVDSVSVNNMHLSRRVKTPQPEYYKDITIAQLGSICRQNCVHEASLYDEFGKLPRGILYEATAAKDSQNMKMNCYKDIIAYDKNRVKLPATDSVVDTDYINASYVEGLQKGSMKYIASQGVIETTIDLFWLMIWSSNIHIIVMLTNCHEAGKLKCKQYWPNEGECYYGSICVSQRMEQRYANYTIRTFRCKRIKDTTVRNIIQFQFTAWPDNSVPDYPLSLVRFWTRVKNSQTAEKLPWLVHGSAGVGRTGTFIALDILFEQAQVEGKVNIFKCVSHLREQRMNMVQTQDQYAFLYQAVLDAVQPAGQTFKTEYFKDLLVNLKKQSPDTQMTLMEAEFQNLQWSKEELKAADQNLMTGNQTFYQDLTVERSTDSSLPEDKVKSRDTRIVPDDQYRPMLRTFVEGHNDYINAVYLETHRLSNGLIITQTPLRWTVIDFYRLLWDHQVETVVMMDSDYENEKGETRHLKMFQYSDWSAGRCTPRNTGSMSQLLDSVRKSRTDSLDTPIVVHCLNGAKKSGLFCVLWTVFERMKEHNEVAVADTVKMMRVRRPQIIPTLEQYKFCYTVIQENLEQSVEYYNIL